MRTDMKNVPAEILDRFVKACRDAGSRGLMRCSSGNLSQRLDHDHFLATASRSWVGTLTNDQVCVCDIEDGSLIEGPRPTVEIGFHASILRSRKDINVVMHYQSPCATAMACRNTDDINFNVLPEIPVYIGPIATIPYLLPGSRELADAVTSAMQQHDMVIMRNHGLVTVATDHHHAIQNAEFFELACDIILRGGDAVEPLEREEVDRLLELRSNASTSV